jgi:hypothetical protein
MLAIAFYRLIEFDHGIFIAQAYGIKLYLLCEIDEMNLRRQAGTLNVGESLYSLAKIA